MKNIYERFRGHGLQVLAFARPEFDFEGDVEQVRSWIARNHVEYPVAIDAQSTNWRNWGVDSWPTHFLVQRDARRGRGDNFIIKYQHVGDRNTHELYNKIIECLKLPDAPVPTMNHVGYTDAEIFMGLSFRKKNKGESGCSKSACNISSRDEVDLTKAARLPDPSATQYTIYGAEWCKFCRMTKTLLKLASEEFVFVDVDEHGGPKTSLAKLGLLDKGHKTLPAVFDSTGEFLGGFSDTSARFPEFSLDTIKASTPQANLIQYDKSKSTATVTMPRPEDWVAGQEALTAQVDGATLNLNADLVNVNNGASLYVVCGSPGAPGQILASDNGKVRPINFFGRHYVRSYDDGKVKDSLRFSKGMKVYVFWLSAEPPHPDAWA